MPRAGAEKNNEQIYLTRYKRPRRLSADSALLPHPPTGRERRHPAPGAICQKNNTKPHAFHQVVHGSGERSHGSSYARRLHGSYVMLARQMRGRCLAM